MDDFQSNKTAPSSGFPYNQGDSYRVADLNAEALGELRAHHEADTPDMYLKAAKNAVLLLSYNDRIPTDLSADQLAVVWFSKTLQNWKALVCTTIPGDELYFEVTYNGDRLEAYVDTYHKIANEAISNRSGALNPRR